ncbi:hypothetical protein BpHYR1_036265, partial [Brachionus plicatilis]
MESCCITTDHWTSVRNLYKKFSRFSSYANKHKLCEIERFVDNPSPVPKKKSLQVSSNEIMTEKNDLAKEIS